MTRPVVGSAIVTKVRPIGLIRQRRSGGSGDSESCPSIFRSARPRSSGAASTSPIHAPQGQGRSHRASAGGSGRDRVPLGSRRRQEPRRGFNQGTADRSVAAGVDPLGQSLWRDSGRAKQVDQERAGLGVRRNRSRDQPSSPFPRAMSHTRRSPGGGRARRSMGPPRTGDSCPTRAVTADRASGDREAARWARSGADWPGGVARRNSCRTRNPPSPGPGWPRVSGSASPRRRGA